MARRVGLGELGPGSACIGILCPHYPDPPLPGLSSPLSLQQKVPRRTPHPPAYQRKRRFNDRESSSLRSRFHSSWG